MRHESCHPKARRAFKRGPLESSRETGGAQSQAPACLGRACTSYGSARAGGRAAYLEEPVTASVGGRSRHDLQTAQRQLRFTLSAKSPSHQSDLRAGRDAFKWPKQAASGDLSLTSMILHDSPAPRKAPPCQPTFNSTWPLQSASQVALRPGAWEPYEAQAWAQGYEASESAPSDCPVKASRAMG